MKILESVIELRKTILGLNKFVGSDFEKFPYNYFNKQTAEEAYADTDLYQCSTSVGDVDARFAVEVNPNNNKIVKVCVDSCDIICKGTIYDCIDFNDAELIRKVVQRLSKKFEKA